MKPALRFYTPPDWGKGANHINNPYYHFPHLLTPEECDKIRDWGASSSTVSATIMSSDDKEVVDPMRRTDISWLPMDGFEWLYDRIFSSVCNTNYWEYDIYGFAETIQYAEYDGTISPAYYKSHTDVGPIHNFRKISMTISLSDSEEYEGGDIEIQGAGVIPRLTKGQAVIFPSFLHHQVLPVTSGIRRSLVSWISGPKLK